MKNHLLLLEPPGLQDALQAFRTSGWLQSSPSGVGSYPPLNIFRKGDDLVLIAEVPGINKSDFELQVKGRTIRLAGTKTVNYAEDASLHRRERLAGRFDRSVTLPVEVDPDGVKASLQCSQAGGVCGFDLLPQRFGFVFSPTSSHGVLCLVTAVQPL